MVIDMIDDFHRQSDENKSILDIQIKFINHTHGLNKHILNKTFKEIILQQGDQMSIRKASNDTLYFIKKGML